MAFHDLFTTPKHDPKSPLDSKLSAEYAEDLLREIGYTEDQILKVKTAIEQSSLEPNNFTSEIVFLADKMDQTGAMAIMRYSSSGGLTHRPLYNPSDAFAQRGRRMDSDAYTIDALMNRVPKIHKMVTGEGEIDVKIASLEKPGESKALIWEYVKDPTAILSTENVREIAKRRGVFFTEFMDKLKIEIAEKIKTSRWTKQAGPLAIMRVFEKSGRLGRIFYDVDDPFCERREPNPNKYPLDELIQMQQAANGDNAFLTEFINEVRLELEGK